MHRAQIILSYTVRVYSRRCDAPERGLQMEPLFSESVRALALMPLPVLPDGGYQLTPVGFEILGKGLRRVSSSAVNRLFEFCTGYDAMEVLGKNWYVKHGMSERPAAIF